MFTEYLMNTLFLLAPADGDMPVYLKMKMWDGSVMISNAVSVAMEGRAASTK